MRNYDMHLAAALISKESVDRLSELGFIRDEFANLTCCHTGEYHGTFTGNTPLPSKDLWDEICQLLEADERFSGYLEEEALDDEWKLPLHGNATTMPSFLPPVSLIECPPGRRKACDIHIGINVVTSTEAAIESMARLNVSSVDRPSTEGTRRVYTITCENLDDGKQLFRTLYNHLSLVPGLQGRMKLEVTTKHFRKPDEAVTLPIATHEAIVAWFNSYKSETNAALSEGQARSEMEV